MAKFLNLKVSCILPWVLRSFVGTTVSRQGGRMLILQYIGCLWYKWQEKFFCNWITGANDDKGEYWSKWKIHKLFAWIILIFSVAKLQTREKFHMELLIPVITTDTERNLSLCYNPGFIKFLRNIRFSRFARTSFH